MAWSPSFYPDLASIRERALIFGGRPVSWNYSNPDSQSGSIDNIRGTSSSLDAFKRIFVKQDTTTPMRAPIVDHVLESYNRLKNANSRLSAGDKQRLDDHIARIAELERKLTAGGSASCGFSLPSRMSSSRPSTRSSTSVLRPIGTTHFRLACCPRWA